MKENEATLFFVVREMQNLGYVVLVTSKNYDSDKDYGSELLLCQDESGCRRNMMISVFYDGLILFRTLETKKIVVPDGECSVSRVNAFREWFDRFAERPYQVSLWTIKYTDTSTVHISIDLPFHGFDRDVFLELYTKFHHEIDAGMREIEKWEIS